MINRVFLSRLVRVAFAAVCGAIWAASALAAATVQITDIPVYGETGTLKGRVSGDINFDG